RVLARAVFGSFRGCHPGVVCDRRATPRDGMHRRPNATRLLGRDPTVARAAHRSWREGGWPRTPRSREQTPAEESTRIHPRLLEAATRGTTQTCPCCNYV